MESIYSVDLSLFAGDLLLGGWSPSVKQAASGGISDGWRTIVEAGEMLASSPTEPHSPVTQFQESNPFGLEWLDTKVDLLDYLAGPELEGLQEDPDFSFQAADPLVIVEDPTARAVQVLKSIAEDNSVLLNESTSSLPSVAPATPPPQDGNSSDFLDLLSDPLDDSVVDSALDPSSILAPMSPEDIDSILSSGPCSPVSVADSALAGSLIALDSSRGPCSPVSVADSALAGSLIALDSSSELDMSGHDPDISMDLLQLLSQVQENELAENAFSMEAESPPTSPIPQQEVVAIAPYRPKPYERPRKPGSNKGLPREVIQQERKLRKKQQNKDAATRYRQKKKAEANGVNTEVDMLEARNSSLRDKVASMTKEISYLKDLLVEVYAAKGLSLPKQSK